MRRAVVLAALLVVAGCGDGAKPPHAPPPALASSGPFEAMFDDAQLEARVLEAARSGRTEGLSSLKLPPRCDRVRVAVRALHNHLVGDRSPSVERGRLLDALEALAKCEGGASAKSLGPLVAAWRGWTDEQVAAEKKLATGLHGLGGVGVGGMRPGPITVMPDIDLRMFPPMSPAAAELAFARAAPLLHDASGNSVTDQIAGASEGSRKAFEDLGWSGGWAALVDERLLPSLLRANSKSFLASYFADSARAAYAGSGDEFRAALVFLAQADAAERDGDFERAERAASAARDRILPTGARGRELFDVLRRHGELSQKVAKQATAARDLAKALEEAKAAGLDAKLRVDVAARLATSLFRLGRFDEAYAVTREAAKLDPSRVELDEIAAQAASELGRPADAAALFRAAAQRGEARSRDGRLLFAARALAKGGDADDAARLVEDVLNRPAAPPVRLFAAGVLRDAGRLDDAEHELTRAATDGGPAFADAVVVERARVAVARGDAVNARAYIGTVVDRLTKGDADKLVGWDLAEPLLEWARLETGLGRLYEASELAGRAVIQLRGSGLEWELDRARKLYVDLQRRRGWFVDAEKATTQRLAAAGVGDAARREDVTLDLLFIRIELVLQKQKDAEKNARAAAAMFPEDWRRDCAVDAVEAALGRPMRCPPTVPASLDARSRWGLLRDLLSGAEHATNVAERAGATEPELRRWALTTRFGAGHDEFLVEMRRRPDPTVPIDLREFVTNEDEAVLLVEPIGERTIVRLLRKGRIVAADVSGDAGLVDFWEATWVTPAPDLVAAAVKRVSENLFPPATVQALAGVRRLWISVPEPLGPLPFDLLPFRDVHLVSEFEVLTTRDLTELSRARAVPVLRSSRVNVSQSPYATLDARNGIVQVGSVDAKERTRFLALVDAEWRDGGDASTAVRATKLALRDAANRDPKKSAGLPAWAYFLLRGAP